MGNQGTKLVYCNGKPQWLMPDGSFVPARSRNDGSLTPGALYLKDRTHAVLQLIRD